jgi:hypothetical protein
MWVTSMKRRNQEWLKYVGKNFFSKYFLRLKEDFKFYKLGAIRSTLYRIQHEYFIEFIRTAVYGAIALEDDSKLGDVYDAHHRDVMEYFKNRPSDLLVMDITKGQGWDILCPFVNKPIPDAAFPCRTNTRFKPLKDLQTV